MNFGLSISSGSMWINLYTWSAIAWEVYTSFPFLFMNNIPGKIDEHCCMGTNGWRISNQRIFLFLDHECQEINKIYFD